MNWKTWGLALALMGLAGCRHEHTIIVNCPAAAANTAPIPTDVTALIEALKDGGVHPDPPPVGAEFGEGMNGLWLETEPSTAATTGRAVVDYNASTPHWTETLVLLKHDNWIHPPPTVRVEWLTTDTNPDNYVATLASGTTYWRSTTFYYDYLSPPSLTVINAIPTTVTGLPFIVRNGTTAQGWMFRETIGTDQYREHWLLQSGFQMSGSGVDVRVAEDSAGSTSLKTFLLAHHGDYKWYLQYSYTLTKLTKP